MKNVSFLFKVVPTLALLGSAAFVFFCRGYFFEQPSPVELSRPQCAHWSILRCCQLLGAPVEMDAILKKLPTDTRGHSMGQVSEVLHTIGFETEGRKENLGSLSAGVFPCIAHLSNPNHFVVISAIDSQYVHLFDGSGQRTARERVLFEKQWSGHVIFVKRNVENKRLPIFLPPHPNNAPIAQFNSLICDLGTVPAIGEPVTFHYTLWNLGQTDLTIEKILPDCSCIKANKTEEPIKSGEAGRIVLDYHVQPHAGPFSHEVVVQTNDPLIPQITLTASGWSGVEVKVQPHHLNLGDIAGGYEKRENCFVKFTGEGQDLRVEIGEVSLKNATLLNRKLQPVNNEIAQRIFPEMLVQAGEYEKIHFLELVFLPTGGIGDLIDGTVSLKTNIDGYEQVILSVSGKICSPVQVFPEVLNKGKGSNQEITLLSRIGIPLEILQVRCGETELLWSKSKGSDRKQNQITVSLEISDKIGCSRSLQNIELDVKFSHSKDFFTVYVPLFW